MAEAAQTPPGPWPSWRALLWAPALPGAAYWLLACLAALGYAFVSGIPWGAAINVFASALLLVVFGYAVTLLCGSLHWPLWKAGWHGPWAYAVIGLVGAAAMTSVPLLYTGLPARDWPVLGFAPFGVPIGLNFWWVSYKDMTKAHRIARGLWVLVLVLAGLAALGVYVFSRGP